MTNPNRQPAGQPTGGQFAEGARASASVSLESSTSEAEKYINALPEEDREVARSILNLYQQAHDSTMDEALDFLASDEQVTTDNSDGVHSALEDAVDCVNDVHGGRGPSLYATYDDDGNVDGWEASYNLDPANRNSPVGPAVVLRSAWSEAYDGQERTGMDAMMEFARAARNTLDEVQAVYDRENAPYVPVEMQDRIDEIIGHDDYSQFVLDGAKDEDYVDVLTTVEDHRGIRVIKFTRDPEGEVSYYEI